jgi:transmembrane sensor
MDIHPQYMKYTEYNIDDFLTDEFFIQWVKNPNENNRHFWEKWLQQHPEKREVVMEAVRAVSSIHYKEKLSMNDKVYIETYENIIKAEKEGISKGNISGKKALWSSIFPIRQVAASLLLLFCIGMVYQVVFHLPVKEGPTKKESAIIKRTNPAGKKSVITLSDGTRIYLNAESEISYASEFSDSLRLVSLKGEAFFEVQKENRPFVVETQGTKISVLGTSFNVNQKNNGALTVALVSGKVSIDDQQGNQMHLEPREMMVREKGGNIHKTTFDPLEVTGWKDKVLVFKKNSLPEVKSKVENWFGVKVQINGQIDPDWSYSGIYKDETLENVLRGIFLTSGSSYKIEEKNVIISNPK